jgi:hypothetical protein
VGGRPNGRTGDKRVHTMRHDADVQYGGSVYDVWMKGSPEKASLHDIVNGPFCPADALFQ